MARKVKITVLKRSLQSDIIEKHNTGPAIELCSKFREGQEFICSNVDYPKPDGFCAYAFGDISRNVSVVYYDSQPGKSEICCCTSAFHPVFFKVESYEED